MSPPSAAAGTVDAGAYLALDPAIQADPYPLYKALRGKGAPAPESTYGVWLVTRYADIVDVVRRPDVFSSVVAPIGPSPDLSSLPRTVLERLADAPPPVHTLVTADPPHHTRYRSILNGLLNVRQVTAWEPRIQQIAEELVNGFAASGECEFVADFAGPLPLRVVAEFLAMPREDHQLLRRWADAAAEGIGNPPRVVEQVRDGTGRGPGAEFDDYFRARIAERRDVPVPSDFVSELVHAGGDEGRHLGDDELMNIIGHFLVAGHETSTKMLTAALLLLVEHPDQLALIRSNGALVANLVEEALRYDAPVQGMFRRVVTETSVGGVPIPAGAMVMLLYASGNRDAAQFADPDRFDVTRANARANLSFGQGVHYCAGAPFARAEGRIGFEVLLRRLDNFRLIPGRNRFERPPSFILRGVSELHVAFDRIDRSSDRG